MIDVQIHAEACRGCRMCVDVCPTKVYDFDAGQTKAVIRQKEDCFGCLSCAYLCPSQAITHTGYRAVKNFYRDLDFSRRVGRFL